jgi:hypothetical protein
MIGIPSFSACSSHAGTSRIVPSVAAYAVIAFSSQKSQESTPISHAPSCVLYPGSAIQLTLMQQRPFAVQVLELLSSKLVPHRLTHAGQRGRPVQDQHVDQRSAVLIIDLIDRLLHSRDVVVGCKLGHRLDPRDAFVQRLLDLVELHDTDIQAMGVGCGSAGGSSRSSICKAAA